MSDKISIVQIGGNVDSAVQGDYHIDVKNVLKEAWQLTLKSRLTINVGLLFVIMLSILVTLILSQYVGFIKEVLMHPEVMLTSQDQAQNHTDKLMLWDTLITIVIWPFVAGIEMLGVLHAVGMKTHLKTIFSFLRRSSWVVICVLFTSTLITLGFQLLIIPGIFLKVVFSLTIPLVVEKKMSPIKAITLSIKALRFKFFPILSIYVLLFFALVILFFVLSAFLSTSLAPVGIMLFIIGLSFLAPLFYNTKGVLYREIFGVQIATNKPVEALNELSKSSVIKRDSDSDDTFSA